MLNDILRNVGTIVGAAMSGKFDDKNFRFDKTNFRFDGARFHFDGEHDGQTLEELDLTQPAPEKLIVMGSTNVEITEGKTFRINASGEGADALRYSLKDGRLVIMRKDGRDVAHVEVTMPAPRTLVVAGSGMISTNALAPEAKVVIAGSGIIVLDEISIERLKANLMGSGMLVADGSAAKLKLNVAGSGKAMLAHCEVETAKITLAGSGHAMVASDGAIEATTMGSGTLMVFGNAKLTTTSLGSGKIHCAPRENRGPHERPPMDARRTEFARKVANEPAEEEAPAAPEKPKAKKAKKAKPAKAAKPAKPAKPKKAKKAKKPKKSD